MPISRREFLRTGTLATGAVLSQHGGGKLAFTQARPALDPNTLTPFVDALPIPALARSNGSRSIAENSGIKIPYYRVPMRAFETSVHRDMKPTRMWGFGGMFPGSTFDLASGQAVLVEWANELPREHFLPIDHTLHGAEAGTDPATDLIRLSARRRVWRIRGKTDLGSRPQRKAAAANVQFGGALAFSSYIGNGHALRAEAAGHTNRPATPHFRPGSRHLVDDSSLGHVRTGKIRAPRSPEAQERLPLLGLPGLMPKTFGMVTSRPWIASRMAGERDERHRHQHERQQHDTKEATHCWRL